MKNKINERKLAVMLSKEHNSYLSITKSLKIIQTLKKIIINELVNDKQVVFKNFGHFSIFVRHPRYVMDPRSKEKKWVEAIPVVKFKTSKKLRDIVKKDYNGL